MDFDHIGRALFKSKPDNNHDEVISFCQFFMDQYAHTGFNELFGIFDTGQIEWRDPPHKGQLIAGQHTG